VRFHSFVGREDVFIGKTRLAQMKAIELIQVVTGLFALDTELSHRKSSFAHKLSCTTNSVINGLLVLKL